MEGGVADAREEREMVQRARGGPPSYADEVGGRGRCAGGEVGGRGRGVTGEIGGGGGGPGGGPGVGNEDEDEDEDAATWRGKSQGEGGQNVVREETTMTTTRGTVNVQEVTRMLLRR